jgi:hypothetical protein
MRWLAVAGVVAAVSAGCAAPDHAGPEPRTEPGSSTVGDACSGHIDALIAARVVPRADREYATGMCEAQR